MIEALKKARSVIDRDMRRDPDPYDVRYDRREAIAAIDAALAQADAPSVTECDDNDSPWLVCKPCAAAGKCANSAARVAEDPGAVYKRGYEEALNDCLRNGLTWARSMFANNAEHIKQADAPADDWQKLYRRALNEANGLTNYIEYRPELRDAERRLAKIEADARDLQARAASAPAAPGWKLVPVEPTADMRNAFHAVTQDDVERNGNAGAHWLAMLAAAPKEPQP